MEAAERNRIVERYMPMVHGMAQRMAARSGGLVRPDERDDMAQEAAMALCRAVPEYDPAHPSGSSLLHYLMRVARNAMLNWLESRGRVPIPMGSCPKGGQRLSGVQARDPRLDHLHAGLESLSSGDRAIIAMWAGMGCRRQPFRKIARRRGLTVEEVRQRVATIQGHLGQAAAGPVDSGAGPE